MTARRLSAGSVNTADAIKKRRGRQFDMNGERGYVS